MIPRKWWRSLSLLAALALVVAACPTDDAPPVDTPGEVAFDFGVTEEPCPGGDPERGCIYLGSIPDTSGPFRVFGPQIVAGQEEFWARVNANGGIGGLFDVHIGAHVANAGYDPALHVREYEGMREDVAALTQTLGTPQTLGIVGDMQADNMIGAVLTWWSGWEFPQHGHILQVGSNYCFDAMNGVEWAQQEYGIESIMTVYFPGDYGGDANAGVTIAAQALGIEVIDQMPQVPLALEGTTTAAVSAIVSESPDAVFLTVGPGESAEIIGGAAGAGYQGRFILSADLVRVHYRGFEEAAAAHRWARLRSLLATQLPEQLRVGENQLP
jgi:ABC-type branched-subunit amino acid transport system substrate-binding protein